MAKLQRQALAYLAAGLGLKSGAAVRAGTPGGLPKAASTKESQTDRCCCSSSSSSNNNNISCCCNHTRAMWSTVRSATHCQRPPCPSNGAPGQCRAKNRT
jgi:hypothetical protein